MPRRNPTGDSPSAYRNSSGGAAHRARTAIPAPFSRNTQLLMTASARKEQTKRVGKPRPLTTAWIRLAHGLKPNTNQIITRVSREVVKSSGCIGYASSIDKAVHADSTGRMRVSGCFVRSQIAPNTKKVNSALGLGRLGELVLDAPRKVLASVNGPTNIGRRRILGVCIRRLPIFVG